MIKIKQKSINLKKNEEKKDTSWNQFFKKIINLHNLFQKDEKIFPNLFYETSITMLPTKDSAKNNNKNPSQPNKQTNSPKTPDQYTSWT